MRRKPFAPDAGRCRQAPVLSPEVRQRQAEANLAWLRGETEETPPALPDGWTIWVMKDRGPRPPAPTSFYTRPPTLHEVSVACVTHWRAGRCFYGEVLQWSPAGDVSLFRRVYMTLEEACAALEAVVAQIREERAK